MKKLWARITGQREHFSLPSPFDGHPIWINGEPWNVTSFTETSDKHGPRELAITFERMR